MRFSSARRITAFSSTIYQINSEITIYSSEPPIIKCSIVFSKNKYLLSIRRIIYRREHHH